jgi:hypothetical protein
MSASGAALLAVPRSSLAGAFVLLIAAVAAAGDVAVVVMELTRHDAAVVAWCVRVGTPVLGLGPVRDSFVVAEMCRRAWNANAHYASANAARGRCLHVASVSYWLPGRRSLTTGMPGRVAVAERASGSASPEHESARAVNTTGRCQSLVLSREGQVPSRFLRLQIGLPSGISGRVCRQKVPRFTLADADGDTDTDAGSESDNLRTQSGTGCCARGRSGVLLPVSPQSLYGRQESGLRRGLGSAHMARSGVLRRCSSQPSLLAPRAWRRLPSHGRPSTRLRAAVRCDERRRERAVPGYLPSRPRGDRQLGERSTTPLVKRPGAAALVREATVQCGNFGPLNAIVSRLG